MNRIATKQFKNQQKYFKFDFSYERYISVNKYLVGHSRSFLSI